MGKIISEATESNGVQFRLEAESDGRVRLECSRDYKGNSHYLELPRSYKTARGARQAAALLAGEKLNWHAPSAD